MHTALPLHWIISELRIPDAAVCSEKLASALNVYSLDEPITYDAKRTKIENVFQDPDTNEIRIYSRTNCGVRHGQK